jgi:hypothetical protein
MTSTYVIDAIWNMYQIIDPGGLQSEAPEAVSNPWGDNGLSGLQGPSHAMVSCGVKSGPVRVTIEEYAFSAGRPTMGEWTDIVELPFQVASGEVTFADWNGEPFHTANLEPGEYRLRVHARGRDEGRARTYELTMDDEPVEEHMIQLFPGTGDQITYKTEDQNGAMLRGETVGEPLPRGRDLMPQEEFKEFERSRDVILGLTSKMSISAQRLMIELITEQVDAQLRTLMEEYKPL